MVKIALLISCLVSGYLLQRTALFDKKSAIVLNNLIVYFFIPLLTLYHVPKIDFQVNLIWLSITPFLIFIGSILFFKIISSTRNIERKTEGALIMTSGIGSISFVGFPVFEILYGSQGLTYGIILSLAGTFCVFNTIGIGTGMYYSENSPDLKKLLQRIIRFPPLIAFLSAVIINISNIPIHHTIDELLARLIAPFSVLALLAIGMQIDISLDRKLLKNLLLGQTYKLIFAPIMIYVLMWHILGIQDTIAKVCILGAAIGSMNAISIVAAQMGLNPRLSALMPALSIPFSIPILFLIDYFLL